MPENDPYLAPLPDPNRDTLSDPRVRGFLDKIGTSEGADYNTLVGGRKIKDLSRHPNVVGLTTSAGPSTAFGKYQITGTTNRSKLAKYKDLDYSPENQDLRAVELLRQTGALDALQSGDEATAIRRAGREWASIPGSPLPGRKNTRAFTVAQAVQDPYLAPLPTQPKPETVSDPYLAPLKEPKTARQVETGNTLALQPSPDSSGQVSPLKTPRVTSTVRAVDEVPSEFPQVKPVEFVPSNAIPRNAQPIDLAMMPFEQPEPSGSVGNQLTQTHYKTPPSTELGQAVKIPFSPHLTPSQDDLVKGYLSALGPDYLKYGEKYKQETGRNILSLQPGDVDRDPDGSAYVKPTRAAVDVLNAYVKSGGDIEAAKAEGARIAAERRGAVTTAEQEAAPDIAEVEAARTGLGTYSGTTRAVESPIIRYGAGKIRQIGGLVSGFGIAPNKLSDYLNTRGKIMELGSSLPPLTPQGEEIQRSVPEKVGTALGDLGLGVFDIIAMKRATGLSTGQIMALEAALGNTDKTVPKRGIDVAQAYAMGKILDGHLNRAMSSAMFAVPTGVESAQQVARGQISKEDAILNTAVQGGLGAILGGGKLESAELGVTPRGEINANQTEAQPNITVQPEPAVVAQGSSPATADTPVPSREGDVNRPVIRHSDPRIDGGEVIGKTSDGKLRVQNNEGGVSVVKNPRTQGNREAAIIKPSASPELLASNAEKADNVGNESRSLETPIAAVQSEVRGPREPKSPVVSGAATRVSIPDSREAYPARYEVREASDVYSSHDPVGFQPNPDYYHSNDRRYDQEKQYQSQVIDRAKNLDPSQVVNNAPTADLGPPIIDEDGNALGGNSRTMIIKRAYRAREPQAREAYQKAITDQASVYGIDPTQVQNMKEPVLVRVLSDEGLAKDVQRTITDLNRSSVTPLTREEQAAAGAQRMSEGAADFISQRIERQGEDATLAKTMDVAGPEIINRLIEDGVLSAGERNILLKDGKVTREAKARVERLLTGRIYESVGQMENTPANVRGNIERVAPAMIRLEGSDWDIKPDLQRAIDATSEARSSGMTLDEVQKQTSMVRSPFTDRQIAIAKTLIQGPRKAVSAFRAYAGEFDNARQGGGLFGSRSADEAFAQHFQSAPKRGGQAGAIDVDLLTLGVRPFAKDVATKGREAIAGTREISNGIKSLLAPPSRSEQALQTSRIVRANAAEMQRAHDIADKSLEGARKFFSKQQPQSNYDFIDRMERGQQQPDPKTQKFADTFRQMLDERRDQIRALGTGKLENFIEDYFPHVWKDPKKAADAFASAASKRPFEGSKSFLKQRTLPLTADGLALGLEPVSDNPVDLAVLKLREMDKYLMAHQVMNEMKAQDNLRFFKVSERLPDGWSQIDDRVATVFSRSPEGELILRGRYVAPEPAAKIVNNYLSPGLNATAFRVPFKAWRATSNLLNQFQLGFSAFHAGFTTVDAMVSRAAVGLEDIARGRPIRGAATVASTPLSPLTNLIQGSKMLKEWYQPGTQGAEIGRLVKAMQEGGGRARMDQFYSNQTAQKFVDTLRQGNILGAAIRAPGAIVEAFSKPVMEQLVPRQKMGIFADLAKRELERLGPDATDAQRRHAMAKAWDSVDNRMGQLVYDNLFWNKTLKDLSMASVRSVGWNIGTIREVGGGLVDYAGLPKRTIQKVRGIGSGDPLFTHRMAYTAALPLVVGTMGAITQKLLTGKGPDELKDYFFPKTGALDENGNPERISFPSYMKDVFHAKEEPGKVVTNKLHPLAGIISEMLRNEDYYGTKIRNEDDPIVQQLKDVALHVGQSALPFSIRGYQKETERGGSLLKRALPFVGITPAPGYINKSPAEKLISQKVEETLPRGARTKEAADRSQLRHQLQSKARNGQDISSDVNFAIKQGKLKPDDAHDILRDAKQTPLQLRYKHLPLKDALEVWDVMTPNERSEVKEILADKASSVDDLPETEQDAVKRKMESIGLRPGIRPRKPREPMQPRKPRKPLGAGYVFQ